MPDDWNRYGSVGVYPSSRRRAAEGVVALWTGYRGAWKGEGRMGDLCFAVVPLLLSVG